MEHDAILNREMVLAAKLKDKIRLSALRMIKSGVHNREIDLKRKMTDSEFLQMLSSILKRAGERIWLKKKRLN
jgi:uncharacterized protein YqeY